MDRDLVSLQEAAEAQFPKLMVWCGRVGVSDSDIDGDMWVKLKVPNGRSVLIGLDDGRWSEQLAVWTEDRVREWIASIAADRAA